MFYTFDIQKKILNIRNENNRKLNDGNITFDTFASEIE